MKRLVTVAALAVFAAGTAACGSSPSGASAPASSGSVSVPDCTAPGAVLNPNNGQCLTLSGQGTGTSDQPPTDGGDGGDGGATPDSSATSAPAGSGPSVNFTYVDPQGWHYSGTLSWPAITFQFDKDISSSPPGQAEFMETIDPVNYDPGTGLPAQTFQDTDPGRPNGPTLQIGNGTFGFHVKDVNAALQNPNCDTVDPGSTTSPKDENYSCASVPGFAFTANPPPWKVGSPDYDEKAVDTFLANLDPQPVAWGSQLGPNNCAFWITSAGKLQTATDWDNSSCGKLSS